jgi:hypothetical protein
VAQPIGLRHLQVERYQADTRRRWSGSCWFPRSEQSEAAAGKSASVTGGDACAGRQRGCLDQRVKGLDGSAFAAARSDDLGVIDSRHFVERHPAGEVTGKYRLRGRSERRAPAPVGQRIDAVEDLGLVDAQPLSFIPPKGAISVEMMPSLMPTMPYSSASATRQMRPMSRAVEIGGEAPSPPSPARAGLSGEVEG